MIRLASILTPVTDMMVIGCSSNFPSLILFASLVSFQFKSYTAKPIGVEICIIDSEKDSGGENKDLLQKGNGYDNEGQTQAGAGGGDQGSGGASPGCTVGKYTEEEKKAIVDEHNEHRRAIAKGQEHGAPAAKNMRELVWNDDLAADSAKVAGHCKMEHEIHDVKGFDYVGQNIAMSNDGSGKKDGAPPGATGQWFQEVEQWKAQPDNWSINDMSSGHYTQMIWAETSQIGCGYATDSSGGKFTVCDYGPGGNMQGAPIYQSGETASECPEGTYNNDGLCASNDKKGGEDGENKVGYRKGGREGA